MAVSLGIYQYAIAVKNERFHVEKLGSNRSCFSGTAKLVDFF